MTDTAKNTIQSDSKNKSENEKRFIAMKNTSEKNRCNGPYLSKQKRSNRQRQRKKIENYIDHKRKREGGDKSERKEIVRLKESENDGV